MKRNIVQNTSYLLNTNIIDAYIKINSSGLNLIKGIHSTSSSNVTEQRAIIIFNQ